MYTSFADFISALASCVKKGLPGVEAQMKLAPVHRKSARNYSSVLSDPQIAAVLALLFPDKEDGSPRIVLMERTGGEHVHASQISFPGGKREEGEHPEATAIRELFEELGVEPSLVKMIGSLTTLYIPASNFLVHPYIAYLESDPVMQLNPAEVKRILTPSLSVFIQEDNIHSGYFEGANGDKIEAPFYKVEEAIVWGATAMMLSEIAELIKAVQSSKK